MIKGGNYIGDFGCELPPHLKKAPYDVPQVSTPERPKEIVESIFNESERRAVALKDLNTLTSIYKCWKSIISKKVYNKRIQKLCDDLKVEE